MPERRPVVVDEPPTLFDVPPTIQEHDGPRSRFLAGLLATWAALDRAGEGAKPLRAETERAKLAADAALTCLGRE